MENLQEEVTVDIFTRLPAKTIIYCKCVSKKWQNLMNNSYFVNLHLSRSPEGLMVQHAVDNATSEILKWVEIEDKHDHHCLHYDPLINFDINRYLTSIPLPISQSIPVGSVNGLICISHRGSNVDNVHICNPITREYLTLSRKQNYIDGHGALFYDFGINSSKGEYKVLRIFQGYKSEWPSLEVYTIGTSQWRSIRQIQNNRQTQYKFGFGGKFLNGYFHWIVHDERAPGKIITFDLDKETFQLFPSPPTPESQPKLQSSQYLGVFKGCLCRSDKFNAEFTLWVMTKYGIEASWHKELVITQDISAGLGLHRRKIMYVFGGLQDGSILVVYDKKLLAYCPENRTIEDVEDLAGWLIVLTHRPSFIKLQNFASKEIVRTF